MDPRRAIQHYSAMARLSEAGATRRVYRLEIAGAVFTVVVGAALHFAFEWAGGWRPLAVVAAVNESIWEHLKLAFWSGLVWGTVVRMPAPLGRSDVLAAKGFGLLVAAVAIVAVFTTYTAILGRNLLLLDIGTFVVAVFAGQLVSGWLLTRGAAWRRLFRRPGLALLGLQCVAYVLLTFFPPDHWLFIEGRSGMRGLPPS